MPAKQFTFRIGPEGADQLKEFFQLVRTQGPAAFEAVEQSVPGFRAALATADAAVAQIRKSFAEGSDPKFARSLQAVVEQLQPLDRTLRLAAQAERTLFEARDRGLVSQAEATRLSALQRQALDAEIQRLDATAAAQKRLGVAAAEARAQQRADQANAQINATLGVRDGTPGAARASAAAFLEAEAAAAALAAEQAKVAASAQALRDRLDPARISVREFAAGAGESAALLKAGAISADEHRREIARLTTQYGAGVAAAAGYGTAVKTVGERFRFTSTEAAIFQSGIVNTVQSLASGVPVATTFSTQLLQTGPAFTRLLAGAGPVVGLIGGLAVAFGTAAVAAQSYLSGQRDLTVALRTQGDSSGYTRAQLEALASATSAAGRISTSTAREVAGAVARAGNIQGEVFTRLVGSVEDYAVLIGKTVPEAASDLARAIADPEKGVRQLDDALNLLDATQRRNIISLARQGQVQEAQKLILDAVNDRSKNLANDGLTFLERKYRDVSTAAANFFNTLGKAAAGERTTAEQLARLNASIANPVGLSQDGLANLQRQRAELVERIRFDDANAQAQATAAAARTESKAIDDLVRAYDPLIAVREQLIDTTRRLAEAGRGSTGGANGAGPFENQSFDAGIDPAKIEKARRANEIVLANTRSAIEEARVQTANAARVAAVPQADQAALAARLEAETAARKNLNTALDAEALGREAAKRVAIEQTRAIANQSEALLVQVATTNAVTEAYERSTAAAIQAQAVRQASGERVGNRSIDIDARSREILREQSAGANERGAAGLDDLRFANRGLGRQAAAGGDPAALQAINRELEVELATRQQLATVQASLAAAIESGSLAEIRAATDAVRTTEEQIEARRRLLEVRDREAATIRANAEIRANEDEIAILQRSIELLGESVEVRGAELAAMREKLRLEREFPELDEEKKRRLIEQAALQGRLTAKLREEEQFSADLRQTLTSATEDALINRKKLGDVARGVQQDFERIFLRRNITKPLVDALNDVVRKLFDVKAASESVGGSGGGLLGWLVRGVNEWVGQGSPSHSGMDMAGGLGEYASSAWAKGGAFQGGNVIPFAGGGVLTRPLLFPMANGMGLAGEAGPEAIMPLRRGPGGRLGVDAGGAMGGGTVVQIIDQRGKGEPVKTERSRGPDGRELLRVIIRDEMSKDMGSRGPMSQMMEATFGLTRNATVRG